MRYIISINRSDASQKAAIQVKYFENGALDNYIDVVLQRGINNATHMNLIYVKEGGMLQVNADTPINNSTILMEIRQITLS